MEFFLNALIFCILTSKNAYAFTFQFCQQQNDCLGTIYNEEFFIIEKITSVLDQNPTYSTFLLDTKDDSEITLKLDGFSRSYTLNFTNVKENSRLILQTNNWELKYNNNFQSPSIFADQFDVIIDNLNNTLSKNLYICSILTCKTIESKDPNRPLFLIFTSDYYISPNLIKSDEIYVNKFSINFEDEITKSMTIIISPIIKSYSDGDYIENPYFSLYLADDHNVTYGTKQVRVNCTNQNIITIKTEYLARKTSCNVYLGYRSVIDVDDNVFEDDLIYPVIYNPDYDDSSTNYENISTIKGNWPTFKNFYKFNFDQTRLIGTYYYAAKNYPVSREFYCTFILTEKVSTIFCIDEISSSLKIKKLNDFDAIFIIDGKDLSYLSYRITEDPTITVIVNANTKFDYDNVYYKRIDNTLQNFDVPLKYQKGGTIITSYGVNYRKLQSDLREILKSYEIENPKPDTFSINYYIDFAKNKISDISYLINNLINEGCPVTISMIDILKNSNQVNTIVMSRTDVLVSKIYQNSFDKETNLVCAESGTLNISEWNVKLGTNLFLGFSEIDSQYWYNLYIPKFSNVTIYGDFISTENGRCIGFHPKSIPGSSTEFIVYTTNTTFIEILNKIDLISILTPSDLDAFSSLNDKKARNLFIFVLDDLPENKPINLIGVDKKANVFLIGFKSTNLDELFDCINLINQLDGNNDVDYYPKLAEYLTRIFVNYQKYYVKASINCGVIQTLLLLCVDFFGTSIRCTNFYPLFSTFSKINQLKTSFSPQLTWTETLTYNSMSELNFREILILPISIDPPNVVGVEQIDFTSGKVILKLNNGLVTNKGFEISPSTFSINTNNIRNQLIIYSPNPNCIFNVPDETENQEIKGIDHSYLYFQDFKKIEGIMTLEKKTKNIFADFIKKSKLFNKVNLLDEEKEQNYKFTGNWDKVSKINGNFKINAGCMPVVVEQVPSIVSQVFDVESEQSIKISTKSDKITFMQPQIITGNKIISFDNKNIDVSFNELIFKTNEDDSTTLSLLLDGNPSKIVTNKVVVENLVNPLISGDLEVRESFEFGPGSSITANSISLMNQPSLILNYCLSDTFCTIPDSIIDPKSITLNYIGESENIDDVFDYSNYLGRINKIKTFNSNDHKNQCEKWKEKASFNSSFYPEFVGNDNKIIKILCIEEQTQTTLAINVTSIPKGEVIIPTFESEIPSNDNDNIDDDGNNSDQEGDDENNEVSNIESDSSYSSSINEGNSNNNNNNTNDNNKKLSVYAIVGIVIGCVVVVAIVIILLWLFLFKNKKKNVVEKHQNKKVEKNVVEMQPNHDSSTDEDFDFWM